MLSDNKDEILQERVKNIEIITLNRIEKHNAFDDQLLKQLQMLLEKAISDPSVHVIILKAAGDYFSAGADLTWMQRVVHLDEAENCKDAMILAQCMYTLYQSPKPTIAVVQGPAFGGGVGLVAACDVAIASFQASFCFSEVSLGLIPAVISPYIIRAIGEREASRLFMTASVFDAEEAHALKLVQFYKKEEELWPFALEYAEKLSSMPQEALQDCKALARKIAPQSINCALIQETAALIAKKRISEEGQKGLKAFLSRRKTHVG